MKLCFVIPVYNERDTLETLAEGIAASVAPHEYTILFVDDGSTDGSYGVLRSLRERMPGVRVIRHRGNFGKSAALATGFAHADGDLVFTMDSDLQDDPKEIPRFLEKIQEGYDVVCGWKAVRHDPWHKTIPSKWYNSAVSRLFDLPLHDVNCGFKVFRTEVVKKIQVYGEMHRLIPVLAHKMNYRVGEIPVEHHRRRYGKSKYGFERFSRGAVDVLTMWFLTRYDHAPAHFFGKFGLAHCALACLCLLAAGVCVFTVSNPLVAVALILMSLIIWFTGVLMLGLGFVAELVLRHFIRIDPSHYATDED